MERENYLREESYLKAKKRAKEIKGFYVHQIVNAISIPIIVIVNLMFVPGFHFFWFALGGIVLSTIIHWLVVFGDHNKMIKKWERKKIEEIMNEGGNFK
ncbi:2TM domain-containing protein [Pseudotenacibaculum haliotis]|uniref:2TM domain-containing protein n=1 Tax=Pseudotenacibaculum haliotis TaxID=1862138 RepID=A0ABW5LUT4_9FLAO